jgi:hypothetical protein
LELQLELQLQSGFGLELQSGFRRGQASGFRLQPELQATSASAKLQLQAKASKKH